MISGSVPEHMLWFPWRFFPVFKALPPEGPKMLYWFSALSLAHRDFSQFSDLLKILCTVDDEIFKPFTILHWGTWFWYYSTICRGSILQTGEIPSSKCSFYAESFCQITSLFSKFPSSCSFLVPLTFPAFCCPLTSNLCSNLNASN